MFVCIDENWNGYIRSLNESAVKFLTALLELKRG